MFGGDGWISRWLRLAPLWVSLWLFAPFLNANWTWQNADGTVCYSCTYGVVAPSGGDCCSNEKTSATHDTLSATNCAHCCKASAHDAPTFVFLAPHAPAVLTPLLELRRPLLQEVNLQFRLSTARLESLPRPPPRGRAPPLRTKTRFL